MRPYEFKEKKEQLILAGKLPAGLIPSHPIWHMAMHPTLDAANHPLRDRIPILIKLNHMLSKMDVISSCTPNTGMYQELGVSWHRFNPRNARPTAHLGGIILGRNMRHNHGGNGWGG